MTIYDFDKIDIITKTEKALNLIIVDPGNLIDEDRLYALKRKLRVYRSALEDAEFRGENSGWENTHINITVYTEPTEAMQKISSISFEVDAKTYKVPVSFELKEATFGPSDPMHLVDIEYNYKAISKKMIAIAKEHIKLEAFTPFGLTWNFMGESSVLDASFNEPEQQMPQAKAGVREAIAKDDSVQVAAVAYDVLAIHPDQTEKTDAIAIDLEHRLGRPLTMIVHYLKKNGEIETLKPYATHKEAEFFDGVLGEVSTETADVDSDEDSAAEMQSWLESLPTVCFLLVSGIDGKIDDKETKAYGKAVEQYAQHSNPLVREIFSAAAGRAEQDMAEVMGMGKSGAILIPMRLAASRQTALKKDPEHAEEFFKILIEMSTSIAAASGGFLGLGSKISKEEKAALTVIEAMLSGKSED